METYFVTWSEEDVIEKHRILTPFRSATDARTARNQDKRFKDCKIYKLIAVQVPEP